MYDYIKGIITYKNANSKGCFATVEVSGVGYYLEITERDFANLPQENQNIKIYTVLIHKEDKMSLCGFLKREERDIFTVLTSVSGVGMKMAMTLLNSFKVPDLIGFVIDGDYKELTKAKGVGQKLAQKIVLELKDKMASYQDVDILTGAGTSSIAVSNANVSEANSVLLSLGYEKDEVKTVLDKVSTSLSEKSSTEDILKKSLQLLSL